MGKIVPLFDPENEVRALKRIQKLCRDGEIRVSPHAEMRMKEYGLEITDIVYVLLRGQVTEITQPKALWRYRVEARAVDGKELACVVEVNGCLVVVTVIHITQSWR